MVWGEAAIWKSVVKITSFFFLHFVSDAIATIKIFIQF